MLTTEQIVVETLFCGLIVFMLVFGLIIGLLGAFLEGKADKPKERAVKIHKKIQPSTAMPKLETKIITYKYTTERV